MKSKAIIFTHIGRADYLAPVLKTAKANNPDMRVVLLGDDTNRDLCGSAEFHHLRNFDSDLKRLRECYVHKSSNSYAFEFSAIARWLAVTNFCRMEGLKRIFNADTDVLIYSDLNQVDGGLPRRQIATYANGSSHASFWGVDALNALRDLIFRTYEDRSGPEFAEITGVYASCGGMRGGISDMYLIQMLCRTIAWFDLTSVVDGATFDFNMNSAEHGSVRFEMHRGLKKIIWRNAKPFGLADGREVQMHALHFQGDAKRSIRRMINNLPPQNKILRAAARALG